jgi:hypothetical protein
MRALNLDKLGVSLSCAVLSGVSRLPSSCFVAILISRVQPPAFESLGPSCGTPCSCDTKSPDNLNQFKKGWPRGSILLVDTVSLRSSMWAV